MKKRHLLLAIAIFIGVAAGALLQRRDEIPSPAAPSPTPIAARAVPAENKGELIRIDIASILKRASAKEDREYQRLLDNINGFFDEQMKRVDPFVNDLFKSSSKLNLLFNQLRDEYNRTFNRKDRKYLEDEMRRMWSKNLFDEEDLAVFVSKSFIDFGTRIVELQDGIIVDVQMTLLRAGAPTEKIRREDIEDVIILGIIQYEQGISADPIGWKSAGGIIIGDMLTDQIKSAAASAAGSIAGGAISGGLLSGVGGVIAMGAGMLVESAIDSKITAKQRDKVKRLVRESIDRIRAMTIKGEEGYPGIEKTAMGFLNAYQQEREKRLYDYVSRTFLLR